MIQIVIQKIHLAHKRVQIQFFFHSTINTYFFYKSNIEYEKTIHSLVLILKA